MKPLRFMSFFSGVGMFDMALLRAGMERVGACEIDPFARRVYEARLGAPVYFPTDVTQIAPPEIPDADVWIGGSPCQSFSVAGEREGLDGTSGLLLHWIKLAGERKPPYFLLENVPGMLTGRDEDDDAESEDADGSSDRDVAGERAGGLHDGPVSWFGAVLGALAESGFRDVAWRELDGQFFGVAQRRRRIFVLARHAGADARRWPHPAEVLLEPEGVRRDPPTGGEAGAGAAGRPADGAGSGGVASALTRSGGHHGRSSPRGDGSDNLVVSAVANALDSNHGNVRAQQAWNGQLVAQPVALRGRKGGAAIEVGNVGDPAFVLRTNGGGSSRQAVLVTPIDVRNVSRSTGSGAGTPGTGIGEPGDPVGALSRGPVPAVAIEPVAFSSKDYGADAGPLSPTLRAAGFSGSHANGGAPPAVAFVKRGRRSAGPNGEGETWGVGVAPTLNASDNTGEVRATVLAFNEPSYWDGSQLADTIDASVAAKRQTMPEKRRFAAALDGRGGVRRLTPLECEKLMGLPPGWTCLCGGVTTQTCTCPDGPRYRAIGNGGVTYCVEWIAKRIVSAVQ